MTILGMPHILPTLDNNVLRIYLSVLGRYILRPHAEWVYYSTSTTVIVINVVVFPIANRRTQPTHTETYTVRYVLYDILLYCTYYLRKDSCQIRYPARCLLSLFSLHPSEGSHTPRVYMR